VVYSAAGRVDGALQPLGGLNRMWHNDLEGALRQPLPYRVITTAPEYGCGLERIDVEVLHRLSPKPALTARVRVEVLKDVPRVFAEGTATSNAFVSRSKRARTASSMSSRLSSVAIISAQWRRRRR
jgi:hypothetical protein